MDSSTQTTASDLSLGTTEEVEPGTAAVLAAPPSPRIFLAAPRSSDLYAVPDKSLPPPSLRSHRPSTLGKKSVRFSGGVEEGDAYERPRPARLDPRPLLRMAVDDLEAQLDPRKDPGSFFNRGIKP